MAYSARHSRMEFVELASLMELGQKLPGGGRIYSLSGPYVAYRQTCRGINTTLRSNDCDRFNAFDTGVSLGIGLRYLIPYYDVILSTEVMWSRGFRNPVKHLSEWGFQKVYGEALMLEIGFRKKSDDQARSRLLMR